MPPRDVVLKKAYTNRSWEPKPLRAELFEGDQYESLGGPEMIRVGEVKSDVKSAVVASNHISKSKAVLAGVMDNIPDVGVGGKSNAQGCVGVYGFSENGTGVYCKSINYEALHAETSSTETAAVAAYQMNADSNSAALFAKHHGSGPAAVFHGNVNVQGEVHVSGDIKLMNADIAEDFTISDATVEEGTVVIFDNDGSLTACKDFYDKKVAGVVSGAGSYKPGMVLDKQDSSENRMPVALLGKVYCKVDADFGSIEVGDMLTTSVTSGHAMVAKDMSKAFGTVIGKALSSFTSGKGLIPILVNLK